MIQDMSTQPTHEESWIPSTDTFGARLALVRWRMGWNQKEAALACGISQPTWRGWELEGRGPRDLADVAARIAARTGVDEYWIMTGKTHGGVHPSGPEGGERTPKSKAVSNLEPLDYKVGDSDADSGDVIKFTPRRYPVVDQPLRKTA
ncbi:Cro protein [Arthrobacter phage Popper]|uniref:Cro protein n=1 Tax=Arthrobacter phage Popper TaxID=2859633 RepID=A0AAE7WDA7_9CAUD|nr:Cro protein [Arthrobacter phage Popper]QYC54958.1 Cro protein [Arthrobacter phage Popper]